MLLESQISILLSLILEKYGSQGQLEKMLKEKTDLEKLVQILLRKYKKTVEHC